MSLPGQRLAIHSTSFQFSVASNWLLVHCDSELTSSMPRTWPARLPKVRRLPRAMLSAQAGLVAMSMRLLKRDFGGTVMPFLMSRWRWPRTCRSTREDERAAFGRGGALDQRADEAAILHDVELEPERLVDRRRHILDRADRHGRERERNAGRLRRPAGENLAVAMLHAAQPDRRQRQRQRGRLAQDGGRGAAPGNIDQNALAQLDALEIGAVGAQRLLRIGAGVGIFEELRAEPGGVPPAAGPRCRSWFSWRFPRLLLSR